MLAGLRCERFYEPITGLGKLVREAGLESSRLNLGELELRASGR